MYAYCKTGIAQSVQQHSAGWTAESSEFESGRCQIFLISTLSRPTQPPIQWLPEGTFPRGTAAGAWNWTLISN
jgi:hypothetical protein